MFQLYHTTGPIGGVTLGYVMGGLAAFMWIGVMVYFFVFFKRKERRAHKLREQRRLEPPQPRKVAPKRRAPRKAA